MAIRHFVDCDRCGKQDLKHDYTLQAHVYESTPTNGGFVTGSELNNRFDYCQQCRAEVRDELLKVLRTKR